jgi:hypothetical protein
MARSLFWAQEKRVRFPYVPSDVYDIIISADFFLLAGASSSLVRKISWSDSISLGSFRDCGPTARHHARIMVTRVRLPAIPLGGCILLRSCSVMDRT